MLAAELWYSKLVIDSPKFQPEVITLLACSNLSYFLAATICQHNPNGFCALNILAKLNLKCLFFSLVCIAEMEETHNTT